jgi:hypothetical protein
MIVRYRFFLFVSFILIITLVPSNNSLLSPRFVLLILWGIVYSWATVFRVRPVGNRLSELARLMLFLGYSALITGIGVWAKIYFTTQ